MNSLNFLKLKLFIIQLPLCVKTIYRRESVDVNEDKKTDCISGIYIYIYANICQKMLLDLLCLLQVCKYCNVCADKNRVQRQNTCVVKRVKHKINGYLSRAHVCMMQ